MEIASFPALDRARQGFLQRRARHTALRATAIQPPSAKNVCSSTKNSGPNAHQGGSTLRESLLTTICTSLDEELESIAKDVRWIDRAIHREHQQVLADLDECVTKILDVGNPQVCMVQPTSDQTPPRDGSRRWRRVLVRRRPRISLVVARQQHARTEDMSRAPATKRQAPVSPTTLTATRAHVIQTAFRDFLYVRLYPGGHEQFKRAVLHRRKFLLFSSWCAWQRARRQRQRYLIQFDRVRRRLEAGCGGWDHSKASAISVRDGKYGVAKEFHASKVRLRAFRGWLLFLTRKVDHPGRHLDDG